MLLSTVQLADVAIPVHSILFSLYTIWDYPQPLLLVEPYVSPMLSIFVFSYSCMYTREASLNQTIMSIAPCHVNQTIFAILSCDTLLDDWMEVCRLASFSRKRSHTVSRFVVRVAISDVKFTF